MKSMLIFFLSLSFLFGFGFVDEEPKIIPVEKAYSVDMHKSKDKVLIDINMSDGVYLYKKYFEIVANGKKIDMSSFLPQAKKAHGEEVYEGNFSIALPARLFGSGRVDVKFSYQGCNNIGICYPPQTKHFTLMLDAKEQIKEKKISNEEGIANTLKEGSFFVIIATFFGFGLLLAFTPCVFPMIPILSSLIVGAKDMNTKKAFIYSLVYVLAMSVAYTIAGVLAGLFGANLQTALQNPYVISVFALIFVALALSMFGFYEIGLPASIQTKLAKRSDEAGSKGGVIGVAIMGFLSALIVGPCVAPPLAGALIYIGQTGDALLGGVALFAMSLGMGAPLILVGTGAGKLLPKPGGWMDKVSKVFGVVMLGVAIWMLDRILPPAVTLLLWAMLLIGSSVYLRALEGIKEEAHWLSYLKKSIGIVLFIYGLFLMIGSFSGASNPLKPFEPWVTSKSVAVEKEIFEKLSSLEELKKIFKSSSKPVMVDISAKWCTSCKELDEITFKDPRVREALREFKALRYDVTQNSQENKTFLKQFSLFGPPAILFFDKRGKELKEYRIIGYKDPKEFLEILRNAKEKWQ